MKVMTFPSEPVRPLVPPSRREVELDGGPPELKRLRWWNYALVACAILLMLAPFDIPIARLSYRYPPTRAVTRVLEIVAEIAGGGIGVLLLLVAAVIVFRINVSRFPRMLSASLGAGLLADIVKLCVYRARPRAMKLSTATIFSTFHGWFPFISAGSAGQSFPSGHATTAAGLAFTLAIKYPRGRWGFAILALTASVTRVIVHAHFLTDIAVGVVLGIGWAFSCHVGFAAPVFTWFERMVERMTNRDVDSERSSAAAGTVAAE